MTPLQDETRTSLHDFTLKASLLYLVSMSTFWMLIIAAGELQLGRHMHSQHLVLSFCSFATGLLRSCCNLSLQTQHVMACV